MKAALIIEPVVHVDLFTQFSIRTISVSVTRDGEFTSGLKIAQLLDPETRSIRANFVLRNGQEVVAQTFLSTAVDIEHLIITTDEATPREADARFLSVSQDTLLNIDVNDGAGGGERVSPARVQVSAFVDGVSAARELVAVERKTDGTWRVAGALYSANGKLDMKVVGGDVYVVALDDWGIPFRPGMVVYAGQSVRPSLFVGWSYLVTEDGVLPSVEPQWWPIEGDNPSRPLGTARAVAVRYYRPLALGPVTVEML